MGLLAWWRDLRARRAAALHPEARWTVTVEDEGVTVVDAEATTARIRLADLAAVLVETNDSGPWAADVWWLLFRADGRLGAGWPQGATGEQAALAALMALPGFNAREMVTAMGSTANATFVLWRRGGVEAPG